jgi:tetrahydromethanopterin S-methyltransferase subunit F
VTPQRFQGVAIGVLVAALMLIVTIPLIILGLNR